MSDRPLLPAWLAIGLFLLAGCALPLAADLQARTSGPTLHDEVVAVSGPTIVAQESVLRANSLAHRPLDARVVPSTGDVAADRTAAQQQVRRGEAGAAVVIDLRRSTDTILVADWLPHDVVAQLVANAGAVSASYGRSLHTEPVPAPRPGSDRLPARLVAGLVALGVALAAALSAWRGPVAPTPRRGAARLAATAGAGTVAGCLAAVLAGAHEPVATAAACATLLTVSAWSVLAAESLLGLAGLGLATGLLLGPVAPLLGGADPAYLPSPWWEVGRLIPQQAGLRLLQHHLMGLHVETLRSWLILVAWAAIAVLTLVASRRARPAAFGEGPARTP